MRELTYIMLPDDEGRQVKRVVRGRLGVSQHLFASLKAQDSVYLDGAPVHADAVVHAGQTLTLRLFDEPDGEAIDLSAHANQSLKIVWEDEHLFVIDKPAPLSCMRGLKGDGDSLEDRLQQIAPSLIFRPVNRLDKGTSGLMAVAKHAHVQQLLQRGLHTDLYVREYLAVVEGRVTPCSGVINAPIGKADGATVRREIRSDGKNAITRYQVAEEGMNRTLLRLRLETGRTHQIRVHLSSKGWPIVGDFLYGREDEALPRRFALHACYLKLQHPITGKTLTFQSEAPDVFRQALMKG